MTDRSVINTGMTNAAPAKPTRRRRRKDARPGEILDAALALFVERGFAATKLDDVAAAAGIGKGTIYLYFPNKEELFRAVVRERLLPNIAAAEALVADFRGSASDLARLLAKAFVGLLESDVTGIPKLIIAEAGNFPSLARFYAEEVVQRGFRLIAGVLARGMAQGEFRAVDIPSAVPLFIAPLLMMAVWRHSLGRQADAPFDPAKVVETHIDVLLRGLAREPGE
jgi:AcrR family transcriptional regulator